MTVSATSPRERTSRAHFYAFMGAMFLASAMFLWMISPFVLALFFGGLLALIAWPIYDRLRGFKIARKTAAALTTALMLLLVLGPLAGFTVLAAREGAAVGRQLAEGGGFSPDVLKRSLARFPAALGGAKAAETALGTALRAGGSGFSAGVVAAAAGIPKFMLQLVLALVAFFFFLLDGRRFADFVLSRAAFERDVQDKLRRTFADMARSTVLAGFAAAAADAAVVLAAFLIFRIPGAFVAGSGTFILSWVPVLGSLPAFAAGIGWLFSQGEIGRMTGMIAFGAAAGMADYLVRPLVLKGRSDVHPLLGLVSIIAGIDMCGILGIFIGPMIAAVLVSLLEIWPEIGARFGVDVTDGAD